MMRPQVLYIGDRDWPEFAAPVEWLARRAAVSFTADIAAAVTADASSLVPFDLLVVARNRPGEPSHAAFESLRACTPLAPIVSLLGSYCEGETRTGKPWPGAVRIYAHQFVARVGRQLDRMTIDGSSAWTPPFTATDDDRLLASSPVGAIRLSARVAVVAGERETAAAIGELLRGAGCTVVPRLNGRADTDAFDMVVWNCHGAFEASRSQFSQLVEQDPRTPKVVLLGFPRAEDVSAALSAGAIAVISKPFLVGDLLWQLREGGRSWPSASTTRFFPRA